MQKDPWVGKSVFLPTVCVDFDGVIADFTEGWKGADVFGEIIRGASFGTNVFRVMGWKVLIFTSRLVTLELIKYLVRHDVYFDEINGFPRDHCITHLKRDTSEGLQEYPSDVREGKTRLFCDIWPEPNKKYWLHHAIFPTPVSFKPVATMYLDDMNVENKGKSYDFNKWKEVTDYVINLTSEMKLHG